MKEANLPFMSRVEESHFKRKLVVVPGMVHEYRHGYQHVLPKYSHNFFFHSYWWHFITLISIESILGATFI